LIRLAGRCAVYDCYEGPHPEYLDCQPAGLTPASSSADWFQTLPLREARMEMYRTSVKVFREGALPVDFNSCMWSPCGRL
jgi:hypothetical protein